MDKINTMMDIDSWHYVMIGNLSSSILEVNGAINWCRDNLGNSVCDLASPGENWFMVAPRRDFYPEYRVTDEAVDWYANYPWTASNGEKFVDVVVFVGALAFKNASDAMAFMLVYNNCTSHGQFGKIKSNNIDRWLITYAADALKNPYRRPAGGLGKVSELY